MKAFLGHSLVLLLLVSCEAPVPVRITSTVGPQPHHQDRIHDDGALKVFSVRELVGDADGPTSSRHSDYTLCTPGGNRLQHVHNEDAQDGGKPVVISLRPGRYLVKAYAKSVRAVELPVLIESGQVTVLHLDGARDWIRHATSSNVDLVTLPNGRPVGWRATSE